MDDSRNRLWTASFIYVWISNFMLGFSFHMLMPTLPFYLIHHFNAGETMIGIVLSSYIIATLLTRPFSGYLVDSFSRKKVYLISYSLFAFLYLGYIVAGSILLLILLRFLHGITWGTSATAGNTLAIDIMPSSRRAEGLGYFGLSANLAMAIGPMVGLFLFEQNNFKYVFYFAMISCTIGLASSMLIKAPVKVRVVHQSVSLDRFILIKGIPIGINLLMIAVSYGMILSFAALYGTKMGVKGTGIFFTLMAIGIGSSRIFAGRIVDRGKINAVAQSGISLLMVSFVFFALWKAIAVYYLTAFFIGFGFGIIFPSFQSMFINLATHNQRGTANATYFTSFDIGVGIGMVLSGRVAEIANLSDAFLIGAIFILISLIYYARISAPHYARNRML